MNITRSFILSVFLLWALVCHSQRVSAVYKIDGLLKRINQPDTCFVVNFWATWCKPCVAELPSFDSLLVEKKNKNIKILLVCLDFREELEKKVNPFLKKNKIQSECVLLDEVNGNDFVNKIEQNWSGAIPATLLKRGKFRLFYEKKLTLADLERRLEELQK